MKGKFDKKGQLTIFIIVAIVIVSVALVYLLWVGPKLSPGKKGKLGFENCVKDSVETAVSELGEKAGFIRPEFTYSYLGEEIPYLCYTNEYYKTCVVQKPFLKQHFEEQLEKSIKEDVNSCYSSSINDLRSRGFDVSRGKVTYSVSIEPNKIMVKVKAPTKVSSRSFKNFNIRINSPLYEMLMVATSILQYESQLGDSDITSLMSLYPDLIIDKLKQSDGTTIYIIENKLFGNKFKFASRSLAWPAGYDTGK